MRLLSLLLACLLVACAGPSDLPAEAPARTDAPARPSPPEPPRGRTPPPPPTPNPATPSSAVIPEATQQLLTVVTEDWAATGGELQRWRRAGAGWVAVGDAVPIVVGRSGLGWGIGLHGDAAEARRSGIGRPDDPGKAEGDGRAPAGAFRLASAFGYADAQPTGLRYVPATPRSVCIDDAASPLYNTVFEADRDPADLGVSLERMLRYDALYRLGVIVDHNGGGELGTDPEPGAGSCIFLHVWRGPGTSTAGCTAMPDAALADVLAWLDDEASPVLVQLPSAAYGRLRAFWALPAADG